ncbi:hypothetical protein BK816_04770 [Boudabousia tangfeifanii]|uniref:non-specific serine/threonine protein kinase n=1 Tax=Boudabousia tangfeifanii TaxID=1912795 RepID=A0A1D9MMF9_9ACTO|nr:hypothetical protein BK816_04770 [Boudabousia tangfeifanii]
MSSAQAGSDSKTGNPANKEVDALNGVLLDGRYRVLSVLARGGMATVYQGLDERLDRQVAIKVLHPHLVDTGTFLTRFHQEARSVAKLIHPQIVTVFDQGELNSTAFIVMELVSGPSLRDVLLAKKTLTIKEALQLTSQILTGLAAAHRQGVVHRDVKPENILIAPDGTPKIADFGLAKTVSEASAANTQTVLGTVNYVPPEVVLRGEANASADLYSLGIMLYEMLCGSLPFSSQTPINVAFAHANQDVPPPSAKLPWLPTEIDDLVSALCARDPEDRFETALSAKQVVDQLLRTLPPSIQHRRETEVDAISEASSANQTQVQSAPIPLLADKTTRLNIPSETNPLPFAPVTASNLPQNASPTEENASKETKSKKKFWWIALVLLLLLAGSGAGGAWWYYETGPGSLRTIPALVKMPLAKATSILEANNLKVETKEVFSDDIPAGEVVNSSPKVGSEVKKGSAVSLEISKGVQTFKVPEVLKTDVEKAKAEITKAGLNVGEVNSEWSEEIPANHVISLDPAPGTSIKHDSAVNLVVSKGRQPFKVPNLIGLEKPEAVKILDESVFKYTTSEEFNDEVPAGKVISQSIDPDKDAFRADEINLVISKGPDLVEVPQTFGMQLDRATQKLEDAGFKVRVEKLYGGLFGTVRTSDPAGGQKAKRGATITLKIV